MCDRSYFGDSVITFLSAISWSSAGPPWKKKKSRFAQSGGVCDAFIQCQRASEQGTQVAGWDMRAKMQTNRTRNPRKLSIQTRQKLQSFSYKLHTFWLVTVMKVFYCLFKPFCLIKVNKSFPLFLLRVLFFFSCWPIYLTFTLNRCYTLLDC